MLLNNEWVSQKRSLVWDSIPELWDDALSQRQMLKHWATQVAFLTTTLKLETNHKKKSGKSTNIWRLNNMLLNNEWVNQEIKEEIKKYMERNENENTVVQNIGDAT